MKALVYQISLLTAVLSFCLAVSCSDGSSVSDVNSLRFNDSWLYICPDSSNVADVMNSLLVGETVAGSDKVALPHYDMHQKADSSHNVAFYYKRFVMPDYMQGRRLSFYFEGVSADASIWFNGHQLDYNFVDFEPCVVDVKPVSGENSLVIMLPNHNYMQQGVWLCAQDSLSFTNVAENLDFNAGIQVSTFDIKDGTGMVAFKANVRNSYSQDKKLRLHYSVLDHNRKELSHGNVRGSIPANSFRDLCDTLKISDITCWNIDEPWLYTIQFQLISDGSVVDKDEIDFGFRQFVVNQGSIRINGKDLFLSGVNTNHNYPWVNRAISREAYWRDAWRIKRGGFDFVNVSAVPHPEYFLDACDHYGIVVLDTCDDSRSRIRRNHPCVFHMMDSRGVRIYGRDMACGPMEPEKEQQKQALMMSNSHSSNRMSKYFADALSSMFDVNGQLNGVMTENRMQKFSYAFFQSQRDIDSEEIEAFAEPFCNVLSNWVPGNSHGVWVCSNCATVELFIDNVSAGKKKVNAGDPSVFLKYPPVYYDISCNKPGTLRAVGYSADGYPMAESIVESPGAPVRIKLVIDESGTLINDNDIVLVHCYILDNKSNTVLTADDEIEFSVTGTAQLMSPSVVKPEAGVGTCLIRTGKSSNDFTISAKCGRMYTVIDK